MVAVADSPDASPTTTASVLTNPDGSVSVTVNGTWAWPTHGNKDCNLDRYAAGWAVAWNDKDAPGNFVGTLNGTPYYVGTPADNAVHYYSSAPRCGVLNPAVGYPTGSWGPQTHTYANAGAVPPSVCVVTYDIHNANGGIKSGDLVAGGQGHNGDNSIQANGQRSACTDIVI